MAAAQPTQAEIDALLSAFNQGRTCEAEQRAAAMTSAYPEASLGWRALGIVLAQQGRAQDALRPMQRLTELLPQDPEAHNNLGAMLQRLRRFAEAEASFRRAVALKPDYAEAQNNLGAALQRQGRLSEAEPAFREAVRLNPDYAEAHSNLGLLLRDTGKIAEAEVAFGRLVALKPTAEALIDRGLLRMRLYRFTEAEADFRQAIALNPRHPEAHNNLGTLLQAVGRLPEAEASFQQALALNPDHSGAHQNLIFTRDLETTPTAALQEERRRWAARFAPSTAGGRAFPHSPDPERRLHVGYVSRDFRLHSAATVFGAMLTDFDAANFEVFAYSNLSAPDGITALFQRNVSHWREIAKLQDDAAAAMIREDGIDILVDLSGHSEGNRLRLFAMKPAPVQISAWGYLTGTGMDAMDVLFSDRVLIPEDERRHFSETVRYLPNAISAFLPNALPGVNELPAASASRVVFGSFNRMCKISDPALAVWARVLLAVPGSRLVIKNNAINDAAIRHRVLRSFADAGVGEERITLLGQSSWFDHMASFNMVDIALDPFPHTGGVTTLEGLMMGVPVVTLRWPTIVGRLSATILTALGMTDWIAETPDEYVAIAVRKAAALPELEELRRTLRSKMTGSVIGDTKAYAAAVEQEYRALWREWCRTGRIGAPGPLPAGKA